MTTKRRIPAFQSWEDAFEFASDEYVRATYQALQGHYDTARQLTEYADMAREIGHLMLEEAMW